ncbi:MAG: hypothetical protein JKY54_19405, partial [Flavobacteriales bacterium]|nr:hypothetical protein [Flavobacteriales bacterium]
MTTMPIIPSEDKPAHFSLALHDRDRSNLVSNLCDALASNFGISPNKQMSLRLQRIYSDVESVALRHIISELITLPPEHPSWFDLVAKLTVHETYFFRDEEQLNMLRNEIFPIKISKISQSTPSDFRILSAGCSTGEEVYSLSMLALEALCDAGFAYGTTCSGIRLMPNWSLEIMGLDVSSVALKIAKKGCYTDEGLGSFRGISSRWEKWFDELEEDNSLIKGINVSRQPKGFVRNITRFEQHNLLQSGARFGLFDVIICRNTMIYFNDENKCAVQHHLLNMLKPDGVLILGA